ncbi:redox-active disulfide protein 2 [Winogradskyella sp. UBA3174]|uniref:redox-active disulfide protein 2 n=1 Tax=Winogradskyella sp. UBA3174 TaxID=1947785 RepID=UPI0025D4F3C4|nr:redox-active disulfide protein 2 [Winogradskyella sp. UBA3174]|tara:strand:+ start:37075 stop:37305 length:231 start_codon:yes stop_codon:yes gene_type:complete
MDLIDKTTEKLKAKLESFKMITGVLIGVLSLLFIVCVYGLLTKEDNSTFLALIIMPFALSAIIPLNFVNIKKIKKE